MDKKTRHELLKSVYEQHWLHARHVENERLWFTNIFGMIVAGLLAFLSTVETTDLPLFAKLAGSFIFILSILGYFLCLTWRAPFVEHTTLARQMAEQYPELKDYVAYTRPETYRIIKVSWITAHQLFLYFYIVIAMCAVVLAISLAEACLYWHIASAVPLCAGVAIERYYQRRENKYRKEMEKKEEKRNGEKDSS